MADTKKLPVPLSTAQIIADGASLAANIPLWQAAVQKTLADAAAIQKNIDAATANLNTLASAKPPDSATLASAVLILDALQTQMVSVQAADNLAAQSIFEAMKQTAADVQNGYADVDVEVAQAQDDTTGVITTTRTDTGAVIAVYDPALANNKAALQGKAGIAPIAEPPLMAPASAAASA